MSAIEILLAIKPQSTSVFALDTGSSMLVKILVLGIGAGLLYFSYKIIKR